MQPRSAGDILAGEYLQQQFIDALVQEQQTRRQAEQFYRSLADASSLLSRLPSLPPPLR